MFLIGCTLSWPPNWYDFGCAGVKCRWMPLRSISNLRFIWLSTGWSRDNGPGWCGKIPGEWFQRRETWKGRDDFWKAVPSLKYGQKRFGSGNLYKRAAQSKACTCNTLIFVNMQAMLKERIKIVFSFGYLQETWLNFKQLRNVRLVQTSATRWTMHLICPPHRPANFLWLSRSRSVWGYRSCWS